MSAPHSVIALPGSPYEGMSVHYWPGGTEGSGVMWTLTWRDAANSGSGAWMFVGGAPLVAQVITEQTTTSTTYTDLATAGPSIAIPSAGIYDIGVAARAYNASGAVSAMATQGPGWTTTSPPFAQSQVSLRVGVSGGDRLTANAGGTVEAKYRSSTAGTAGFAYRRLTITPVELRP